MKACLILWDIEKINKEDIKDSFIVGVDLGSYNAISHGITPDIAIGDFDSCKKIEFDAIKKNSKKIIQLNPIKDKTDTEEAILLVKDYDEILILGGIKGKRIEHFYANLMLLFKYPKVKMKDENSLIEIKRESFIPNKNYKYISLFPIEDTAILSLTGMKYNLENYTLKRNEPTLGISNECMDNPYVEIQSGSLLVISSMEDHENL